MLSLRGVMSGEDRGAVAGVLRRVTAVAEPAYAAVTAFRNFSYDRGWIRRTRIPRPVISIGNLTTGGTGKTPTIQWLATRLCSRGLNVAVLARGYKSTAGGLGDEQEMLRQSLAQGGGQQFQVIANPNRVQAAIRALANDTRIDVFLLDDGFQHRKVRRDLDILLISATLPFGFNHVLPRGLLRERVGGLARADVVVITHADQVPEEGLLETENRVRRYNPGAPIYRAIHAHIGMRNSAVGPSAPEGKCREPMEALRDMPFFAFAGIGDPEALDRQLKAIGDTYRGCRWFKDHHRYVASDLGELAAEAERSGARVLVTTEKDWAKLGAMELSEIKLPIWRLELAIVFAGDGEAALMERVEHAIANHSATTVNA